MINEALTIGKIGLSVGKMFMGDKVAEQQAYNSAYNTAFNNAIGQYQADKENEYKIKAYEAKMEFTKEQITNNFLESQAYYQSKQIQMQEMLGQAAFKSQSMRKALAKSFGASAAREVYGKSARRAALIENLGEYGRQRREYARQLTSSMSAAQRDIAGVERKRRAQDRLAISGAAATPIASTFIPTPAMQSAAPGLGQQLMGLAGDALSAVASGYGATQSGEKFFGRTRT